MLTEIIIALLLSICTTALLLFIANFLQKKWNIHHPKNTFLIYVIILLTAASFFPYASIALSTSQNDTDATEICIPDIQGIPVSDSTIITENQNITYASSITPLSDSKLENASGITRYLQTISWKEMIILDEYQIKDSKQRATEPDASNPLNTSQFMKKTLTILNKEGTKTPELINQIITNLLIDQNSKQDTSTVENKNIPHTTGNKNNEKREGLSVALFTDEIYFYYGILLLFLLSFFYIFSSIYFGKTRTLHHLHASKCEDHQVIDLIKSIAKEFHIKPPAVYYYEGPPNAFVFGYPITLAFSKELKQYLSEKEFEAALRHELAHIKNHDILIKPIIQGLRIFFFYNPLVHILCLKIMKNREILADASTFSSKKEKISLMEALIKVNEYSKNPYHYSFPAYQIPLMAYNPTKLTLTERFSNLFEMATKKTVLTVLVSCILLLANLSIFFVAGTVFESQQSEDMTCVSHQEFSIDESYYTESLQYTKIERNAKTYIGLIVQKNLYNVISTNTPSSEMIEDMVQNLFPQDNMCMIHCHQTNQNNICMIHCHQNTPF